VCCLLVLPVTCLHARRFCAPCCCAQCVLACLLLPSLSGWVRGWVGGGDCGEENSSACCRCQRCLCPQVPCILQSRDTSPPRAEGALIGMNGQLLACCVVVRVCCLPACGCCCQTRGGCAGAVGPWVGGGVGGARQAVCVCVPQHVSHVTGLPSAGSAAVCPLPTRASREVALGETRLLCCW
jgi:hypothetical protein